MNYPLLFIVINVAIGIATTALLIVFFKTKRDPFTTYLTLSALIVAVTLFALHWYSMRNEGLRRFWWWLFDIDNDRNLPAIFSSVIWLFICLILIRIGFNARNSVLQKLFWFVMALIFLFFAVDDFFAIHETMIPSWRRVYLIGALCFGAASAVAYWRWFRHDFRQYPAIGVIIAASLVVFGVSGLLVEAIFLEACPAHADSFICQNFWQFDSLEEMHENLAAIILMAGLLLYAQKIAAPSGPLQIRRSIPVAAVIWPLSLGLYIWVLPTLESQLKATPVVVEYATDELELVGFTASSPVITANGGIRFNLYWKTDAWITKDYRLSLHLVSHPDVQSIGQADAVHIGQIPSQAWLPGVIIRKSIHIDLPETITTPASYWLILRVWSGSAEGDWLDTDSLNVRESDRPLLTEDTVILTSIAALPPDNPGPMTTPADYQFVGGLSLAGFSLPQEVQEGTEAKLQFQWQTTEKIGARLIQFIHIFDSSGHEFRWGYDQEPFGGSFPTTDWPANMDVVDTRELMLPDDLDAGVYRVYTGLYDSVTAQRVPVTGADGSPAPDYRIELGILKINP